jgi:hypothetical protein
MAIKKILKKIIRIALSPFILKDYLKFKSRKKDPRFFVKFSNFYPQIKDKTINTNFDYHYVYQTGWAIRKIKEISPELHTDISSSLYFIAGLSAFIPVKFYDYRPAELKLSNLETGSEDLTKLSFKDESINSLSCLHTIEHVGLGRYGDPIDPDGDIKASKELQRVLSKDGYFVFVTPVGQPKIEFNAHRIYSYEMVLEMFDKLKLLEFSLVTDSGDFIENANPDIVKEQEYGCGCFLFKKNANN